MKKQIFGIILTACFVLVLFTGCSQESLSSDAGLSGASPSNTTDQASFTPEASSTQTVVQTEVPSESAGEAVVEEELKIEFKDVAFDQAANDYFNGDAKAELNKMYVLLNSAAMAEFVGGKPLYPDENTDISMEWAIVYQYINSYGENDDNGIQKMEDSTLVVPEDKMLEIFNSFFSFFQDSLPELNTDYAITYDKDAGTYSIGRSDFGEISFAVTGFSLSKASAEDSTISATVALTAFDIDGNSEGVILVEFVPKTDTMYGYSIQSLTME